MPKRISKAEALKRKIAAARKAKAKAKAKRAAAVERARLRKDKERADKKAKKFKAAERIRIRKENKRAKRELRMAPKRALKDWSIKVRANAGNRCEVCGIKHKYLNAAHVLPKERYPQYKFEVKLGIAMCPNHHKWGKESAHVNPVWFTIWIKENRPEVYRIVKKILRETGEGWI